MKIAFVIQRYGEAIAGGAEMLCRRVAEHLAKEHAVEVLTTCAEDYVTWANQLRPGLETVNGIPVRRFPVSRPRRPEKFGRIQEFIFNHPHTTRQELKWLEEEGPCSPALVGHIDKNRRNFDLFIFFSYRYYITFHGLPLVAERSILVPTAEHDPVIHLGIFRDFFKLPGGIVYLTPEEQLLIESISGNRQVPGDVIGGLDTWPGRVDRALFHQRHGLDENGYILYLGRVDENKGCRQMFAHYIRYAAERKECLPLVVVGRPVMEIPRHPGIRHVGFVPEEEKFAALAGSRFLLMPSFYESLCMVVLEAWTMGTPALVNGRCDVLRGQVTRGGGGLWYGSFDEFLYTMELLSRDDALCRALGRSGRRYCEQTYAWERIEEQYRELIGRVVGR
jgi:glycosyltransferase involved in cell wall biosynthesis